MTGSTKVEMIQLAPVRLTQKSIYERDVTSAQLPDSKLRKAERVELGVRWQCACDIDIFAQPFPGAAVLSYKTARSPQGLFFKDYRDANATEGYETIEFAVPLDLRVLKVAVNLYEGSAPQGVTGELRMTVDGQTYAMPFNIPATSGNGGADAPTQGINGRSSKHTITLDVLSMLGA